MLCYKINVSHINLNKVANSHVNRHALLLISLLFLPMPPKHGNNEGLSACLGEGQTPTGALLWVLMHTHHAPDFSLN